MMAFIRHREDTYLSNSRLSNSSLLQSQKFPKEILITYCSFYKNISHLDLFFGI